MAIRFHSEKIRFELKQKSKHKSWIEKVIKLDQRRSGNINIIFTSNKDLKSINRDYLNHNYFTDVITFDYSKDNQVSGDIFISIDQVRENAAYFKQEDVVELRRVMIHGILHLMGFRDSCDEEKSIMRKKENDALILWSE